MELYIKNMVCPRCISSIENIFKNLDIALENLELGTAITRASLTQEQLRELELALKEQGFEILKDYPLQLIEKIKTLILQKVQGLDIEEHFKLSSFLSDHTHKEYSSLSKLFSQTENITLEQYYIFQKIEKVKELLTYKEYSLTQIADMLGYKSLQHLSSQFKKVTGLSPSQFQKAKNKLRYPLDKIIIS
ncbi:helix-turn-helix domain-containing protein [Elizabethkingia argentiflava]|uniref:Helix-turn-helix domain-containing protein n=2 Tax=Elizabethkingia argenteiflava TaxID=2681556 RepID=A0A845PY67_9FLAO|nr:helix-turn-helix domain-containing protein [Elizabethkingia argenteiflava]